MATANPANQRRHNQRTHALYTLCTRSAHSWDTLVKLGKVDAQGKSLRQMRGVARGGRKVRVILLVWCTGGLVVGVSRKGRPQQVLVKRVVRMCVVRSLRVRMGVV